MRPLDVLVVLPSLERGGAERVAVNLMNGFAETGSLVGVVVANEGGPLTTELSRRVAVHGLGQPRFRRALAAVLQTVRTRAPDVVLATHTHVNLALCATRPLLPHRTLLAIREPIHAPVELEGRSTASVRMAQRLLYRRADLVLASSSEIARDLAALTGANIVRLENAVDITNVRRAAAEEVASQPSRADGGRRIVSVGRLTRQKAMDELVRAFAEGSGPADTLEILGEGPERGDLERTIPLLGLEGRVMLPGLQPDHLARVAVADALVLASRAEGMPNVVLEALALGTPVVATDELTVLRDLAEELGPHSLRLVPRRELARTIAALPPRTAGSLRPSALPERFDRDTVVAELHALLVSARDGR